MVLPRPELFGIQASLLLSSSLRVHHDVLLLTIQAVQSQFGWRIVESGMCRLNLFTRSNNMATTCFKRHRHAASSRVSTRYIRR